MNTIELQIDKNQLSQEDVIEAAKELFYSKEQDFNEIKNRKWYKSILNAVTFGKEDKKFIIKNISDLATLQRLFLNIYLQHYKALSDNLSVIIQTGIQHNEIFKKIYYSQLGIQPQDDPKTMPETDQMIFKKFLGEYNVGGIVPDKVQTYNRRMLLYLGGFAPAGELSKDSLGKISNPSVFYRCLLEQAALNGNLESMDLPDNVFDDIEELNISARRQRDLEMHVRSEANIYGAEYFLYKYSNSDEVNKENRFLFDTICREESLDKTIENTHNSTDGLMQGSESGSGNIVGCSISENDAIEEYIIEDQLVIPLNEEKIFKTMKIHFGASIVCKGEVLFENCVIYCKEENYGGKICVEDGKLKAVNCTFIMKTHDGECFIKGTREESFGADLEFESCKFIDCGYFIGFSNTNDKLIIHNSEIINPNIWFVGGCVRKYVISNCIFNLNDKNKLFRTSRPEYKVIGLFNAEYSEPQYNYGIFRDNTVNIMIPDFENKEKGYEEITFLGYATHVSNCKFYGGKVFDRTVIAEFIEKCTFIDDKNAVFSKQIEECYFENCIDPVQLGEISWMNLDDSICILKNSVLCGCGNQLVEFSNYPKRVKIINTTFKNMTVNESNPLVEYQSESLRSACIKFTSCKDTETLLIENCTFENIDLKVWFLIANNVVEKITPNVCQVIDCNFRNVVSERKDGVIINTKSHYLGLFKREIEVTSVHMVNCKGLY